MDINILYLPIELIDNICELLYKDDKLCFILCNKYIYYSLHTCLIKYNIFSYINKNYEKYYSYITKYIYNLDELTELIILSIQNIPYVYKIRKSCSFYDMRYLFELLLINKDLFNKIKIPSLNLHFYKHFYQLLYECITSNRYQSINNINNNKLLIPLHRGFKTFDILGKNTKSLIE